MGIYQYTLRAPTKKVDGVEVGQYKFAWKHGWGAGYGRGARMQSYHAENAAYKLERKGVRLYAVGDWHDGQPLYWIKEPIAEFTEELRSQPIIAYLHQDSNRRWHIRMCDDAELHRMYPEIGVLQTAQGKRYYVGDDDRTRFEFITGACKQALILRRQRRGY